MVLDPCRGHTGRTDGRHTSERTATEGLALARRTHGFGIPRREQVAPGPLRHARAGRPHRRAARERHDHEGDRAFIEARDMFFLATADAEGRPTCSYKGGDPGFVRVLDPHTVAFPSYDGNGMYLSAGNVLVEPRTSGMLFIDFERGHRMRLEGTASIDLDDPLRARVPRGPVRRPGPGEGRLPQLPPLHPPLRARAPLTVRAAQRLRHTGSAVEALRLGHRRTARARPGPRPGRARGPRPLSPACAPLPRTEGPRRLTPTGTAGPARAGPRRRGRRRPPG